MFFNLISDVQGGEPKFGLAHKLEKKNPVDLFFEGGSRYFHSKGSFLPEVLSKKEFIEIRDLEKGGASFSTIHKTYKLAKVIFVLGLDFVKNRFEKEFGSVLEINLLERFKYSVLRQFCEIGLISEAKMEKVKSAVKEDVQSNIPFSKLLLKYDFEILCEYLTVEQLKEKFNEEYAKKSAQEIVSELGAIVFLFPNFRQIIGSNRLNEFNHVRVERKDGTIFELALSENSYSFSQTSQTVTK